jgi:hypothetical protein
MGSYLLSEIVQAKYMQGLSSRGRMQNFGLKNAGYPWLSTEKQALSSESRGVHQKGRLRRLGFDLLPAHPALTATKHPMGLLSREILARADLPPDFNVYPPGYPVKCFFG